MDHPVLKPFKATVFPKHPFVVQTQIKGQTRRVRAKNQRHAMARGTRPYRKLKAPTRCGSFNEILGDSQKFVIREIMHYFKASKTKTLSNRPSWHQLGLLIFSSATIFLRAIYSFKLLELGGYGVSSVAMMMVTLFAILNPVLAPFAMTLKAFAGTIC